MESETNETAMGGTCGPEAAGDGLDAFTFAGADDEGQGADDASTPLQAAKPGVLDQEQFFAVFRALVGSVNGFLMLRGVAPLQALTIAETDQAARAASDALYDTCAAVPWLRFLIEPESVWAQRAIVVGSWAYGVVMAARAELAGRRLEATNDNPQFTGDAA